MSMRGRGGRGGRGGGTKSFNKDQLNALGVTGNEVIPGPVTQPPPLYPLLDRQPVALTPSLEINYLLILKQDFLDQLNLSASYLNMPEKKTDKPEQEIDILVAQLPQIREKYDWHLFPAELRPKLLAKKLKKKVKKEINIQEKLQKLEKIEENTEADVSTQNRVIFDDDEDEQEVEEVAEDDQDEEMDDGTDYANNYFDNGEDYEDEDDNLDDGPIY